MEEALIERMLMEDDYLIQVVLGKASYEGDGINEEVTRIRRFFHLGSDDEIKSFDKRLSADKTVRADFLSYSREKLTYKLATLRSNSPIPLAIVWCSAGPR